MQPTVSIIVPVYNAKESIRRCVDSILSQEYGDFELLLVDDGSQDGSGAICDDYAAADDRVRVIHQENAGVSAARNRALDQARALKDGDVERFLELVRQSGQSSAMYLQNVIPTGQTVGQELMVTIALCECLLEGRGAVRVHGGGFGGTAQAFVPLDMLARFKEQTEAVLGQGSCHIVTIRPEGGVRLA